MSGYSQIKYDVQGPVALLTLHRPEKMNAFTRTMMAEIIDAIGEADGDDRVRAEIFTGDQLIGSGTTEVPVGELGEQVDDRSELLSTEVCRPVDWVLEEAADEGTFFMGEEDGSASMSNVSMNRHIIIA